MLFIEYEMYLKILFDEINPLTIANIKIGTIVIDAC